MAKYILVNGVRVEMTAEEQAAREAEEAAENAEQAANSYKTSRRRDYPSIKDQLDIIYHSGIDAWKAKIKETKDKYPNP